MIRWLCSFMTIAALVGCSNSSPDKKNDPKPDSEPVAQKDSVDSYVQRALKLHTEGQDKDVPFRASRNARLFGVRAGELDSALQDPRYKGANDRNLIDKEGKLILERQKETERLGRFGKAMDIPVQDLQKMIAADKKWNEIEVAMLLDQDLIGDARCWEMETGEKDDKVAFFLFVRPNKLSLEQIVSRHGQPQRQHESPGGNKFLFYGRIIVIQPKDGLDPLVCRFTKP